MIPSAGGGGKAAQYFHAWLRLLYGRCSGESGGLESTRIERAHGNRWCAVLHHFPWWRFSAWMLAPLSVYYYSPGVHNDVFPASRIRALRRFSSQLSFIPSRCLEKVEPRQMNQEAPFDRSFLLFSDVRQRRQKSERMSLFHCCEDATMCPSFCFVPCWRAPRLSPMRFDGLARREARERGTPCCMMPSCCKVGHVTLFNYRL